jgi:hypothetical protein
MAEAVQVVDQEMVQVGIWMPPTTKSKLEQICGKHDRSMSSYIRVLIEKEYKRTFGTDDAEVIGKVQA